MSRLKAYLKKLDLFIHSIRFRLVLWFAAILVLVLVSFSGFIYYSQYRDLHGDVLSRLEPKMIEIQRLLFITINTSDRQNPIVIPKDLLDPTDVFVLLGADGHLLGSLGPIPAEDAIQLALNGLEQQQHSQRSGNPSSLLSWTDERIYSKENYLFVIAPIAETSGEVGFAILGSPLDAYGQLEHLLTDLFLGSLLTLVIAMGGGFWLAERAMRPVQTITQAARTISETDLSHRLNMKNKDELGELANTFDGMLARLEAAFERQRQFTADASHELRTPLTIVNLEASHALAARRTQKEYERALGIIRSENDYMTNLVNDLLTLARMDAGQTPLEKAPLDLSEMAVEAVERLMPLATRNGVLLETGDLPEANIMGDRQSILQMISNLVENGIKYTSGDNRKVMVETGRMEQIAWLRVSDNGPGIAAEHIPYLFNRFYRVDKARTRDSAIETDHQLPGGSGLGLSIIQWIVKAHSGEIRVESTPGVGTMFEVCFNGL